MTAVTTHAPDSFLIVMQDLFVSRSLGTLPPNATWPVYAPLMADSPSNAIALQETLGIQQGRDQIGGGYYERKGLNVLVRGSNYEVTNLKARDIVKDLTETIETPLVFQSTTSSEYYRINGISKVSGPLSLGQDVPSSVRYNFSINMTVSLDWLENYSP